MIKRTKETTLMFNLNHCLIIMEIRTLCIMACLSNRIGNCNSNGSKSNCRNNNYSNSNSNYSNSNCSNSNSNNNNSSTSNNNTTYSRIHRISNMQHHKTYFRLHCHTIGTRICSRMETNRITMPRLSMLNKHKMLINKHNLLNHMLHSSHYSVEIKTNSLSKTNSLNKHNSHSNTRIRIGINHRSKTHHKHIINKSLMN